MSKKILAVWMMFVLCNGAIAHTLGLPGLSMIETELFNDYIRIFKFCAHRSVENVDAVFGRGKRRADYLIVHACPDGRVFTEAVRLWQTGAVEKIIVSGGKGHFTKAIKEFAWDRYKLSSHDFESEAHIIRRMMLIIANEKRVMLDEEDILIEEKSTNTPDNITYTVEKYELQNKTVIYIQTPIQQLRTYLTFLSLNERNRWNIAGVSYAPYLPHEIIHKMSDKEFLFHMGLVVGFGNNEGELVKILKYGPDVGNNTIASVPELISDVYRSGITAARICSMLPQAEKIQSWHQKYYQVVTGSH